MTTTLLSKSRTSNNSVMDLATQLQSDDQLTSHAAHIALRTAVDRSSNESTDSIAKEFLETIGQTEKYTDNKGKEKERNVFSDEVRNRLIEYIGFVAGEDQIEDLAKLASDVTVAASAIYALSMINSTSSTKALLGLCEGNLASYLKVAVYNAMGRRTLEGDHLTNVQKGVHDPDEDVALAACGAICNTADPANDKVLLHGMESFPKLKSQFVKLRIQLAETMAKNNKADACRAICRSILKTDGLTESQKQTAQSMIDG